MDETPDIEPEAAAELADDELDDVEGGGMGEAIGGAGGTGGIGPHSLFGTD